MEPSIRPIPINQKLEIDFESPGSQKDLWGTHTLLLLH